MDVMLLESFDQDATLATQFDKNNALSSSLNQSNFYSFSSESNPISIIQISICNTEAAVCADTGATHLVAGEKLYHLLKQKGLNFEEKTMQMTLADGRTQTTEILTTSVDISIQGKVIPTELLILKNARGNRTLLGIDFLTATGIVLDLQRKQWYFTETSHRIYNFVKAPPNINALLTADPEPHLCQLRKNEGTHLSLPQREEINSLLEKYEECFQPGGEPTPFIEHRINTRNHSSNSRSPILFEDEDMPFIEGDDELLGECTQAFLEASQECKDLLSQLGNGLEVDAAAPSRLDFLTPLETDGNCNVNLVLLL
ncbi:uncharacterized protein TNCV_5000531 [Trichonephila clavipes]|nr:uncharacterized protein TNCV_5000531 [Trichonephila clavipes]